MFWLVYILKRHYHGKFEISCSVVAYYYIFQLVHNMVEHNMNLATLLLLHLMHISFRFTVGVMNRLKRYLPLSAMKLLYDSLILSHLQFGITNWGFEWDRISKLHKRALRIMTNSRYNAHTEPLFKQLHLLKVKDIFEIQCLKFWYRYVNNKLPNYLRYMFTYNHELHEIKTRNHDRPHLYPTRTSGARNVLRHHIPELLDKFPPHLVDRFRTHSLFSVSHHIKCYLFDLYSYDCDEIDCYILTTTESEKSVIRWPRCCGNPLITDFGSGGNNNMLNSEHWNGVIRRDRVSISLMHRSDNFSDFRHWPHRRLSNDNFLYSRWW